MRWVIGVLGFAACSRAGLEDAAPRLERDAAADLRDAGGPDEDAGCVDADGDGFLPARCGGEDCDDADGTVHPGAAELEPSWAIEDVRTTDALGLAGPLVLDPEGGPHILYGYQGRGVERYESEYWSQAGAGWTPEGLPMRADAVAVDGDGARHVLSQNDAFVYSTDVSGEWAFEILSGEWGTGSIATCADGTIHAVWTADTFVHHGVRIAGAWQTEVMDGPYLGGYWGTAIACGTDGVIRLAYSRNAIVFATDASGPWTTEVVEWTNGLGRPLQLAISESGEQHLLFSGSGYESDRLVLATRGAAAWEQSVVTTRFGGSADLALDATGAPHVVYGDGYGQVHLARRLEDTWVDEGIESTDASHAEEIAIDAEGGLHVSYERFTHPEYRLRYAYKSRGDGIDQDCDGRDLD